MEQIASEALAESAVRIPSIEAVDRIRTLLDENDYALSARRALTTGSPEDEAEAKIASRQPLVRLLLKGTALELDESRALFCEKIIKDWVDAGLLALSEKGVFPLVRIMPYRGLLIVSDCDWVADAGTNPDVVMGLTGTSAWLAEFAVRAECESALDLGTGTGVQAMLAARHCENVVATDINPRALDFARFNAALNGIDNIEFVEDDMLEDSDGRTFDLVLSNPPFTVSPATVCLYRDNNMDDDAFVQKLIGKLPTLLNEGGFAQIVCNWVQRSDEKWTERLSRWLKPSGCDAWVVRRNSLKASEYARTWLKNYDTSNVSELFADWMTYYKERGIESIDSGLITMRRATKEKNWLRVDSSLPRAFPDAGAYVARCFWLQDLLERSPGAELLHEILYVSPSVELTQTRRPEDMEWKLKKSQLTMTRGIAFSVELNPIVTRVVTACNGRASLGRILQAIAITDGTEFDVVVCQHLDAIRRLVMLGFLWPSRHNLDAETAETEPASSVSHRDAGGVTVNAADDTESQGRDEEEARSSR